MTAAQWAIVNEFEALLPNATVVVRVHRVQWKHDMTVDLNAAYGVLVTQRESRCGVNLRRRARTLESN
jgi:hypothetical protein